MRLIAISLLVLWGSGLAWAEDVTVIYRKADGLIAGWVVPPHTVAAELQNILRSDLGGTLEEYAFQVVPRKPHGHEYVVTPGGQIVSQKRKDESEPIEIPLSDFGAVAGGLAGAASLVIVARKKRTP